MALWVTILTWCFVCGLVVFACVMDLIHNRKPPNKYPFKFKFTRFINWFIIGMAYACTYFGRYNMSLLNTSDVHDMLGVSASEFGLVLTIAYIFYAVFVTVNGTFVDRMGGKRAMMIGTLGSSTMNLLMGIYVYFTNIKGKANIAILASMYSINDFFQTFCTTAICKVGVSWYHITERGLFSGLFGIIISFGFFLAFQVNGLFKTVLHYSAIFTIPSVMLGTFCVLIILFTSATPEDAGWPPVQPEEDDENSSDQKIERTALLSSQEEDPKDMGSSSQTDKIEPIPGQVTSDQTYQLSPSIQVASTENGPQEAKIVVKDYGMPFTQVLKTIFCNPVFLVLCVVDFCVGWCRDGFLNNYTNYIRTKWGVAEDSILYEVSTTGVTVGSMFGSLGAGVISDMCCGSRRPPVGFFSLIFFTGFITMIYFAPAPWVACVGLACTSFCFSSVHGIITSTCAMDFAGEKATATAVGVLDGVQKIGSSLTGVIIGKLWERWSYKGWLLSMIPAGGLGALLMIPILNKKGKGLETKDKKKKRGCGRRRRESQIEVADSNDKI
ncbi:putative MFS transporter [Blattamonas nauphoetae]|uniref:MFS transporter n=1 Tax=Blattamonas nauphoetae TaxID=2049346 RepID=A0ABQ9XPX1_9EUKA|nr:putative MFS transporter [Blattamonas nauphoetae]